MWKAAVIGLGKIGLMYDFEPGRKMPSSHVGAYHLHTAFDLVMASDPNKECDIFLKKIAPEATFFENYEDGLVRFRPDIVSICTPPHLHLPMVRFLFSLSKPPAVIFCEKPLAGNLAEASEMLTLCKEHPHTVLVPNISRRWSRGLHRVTEAVQHGEYGRLEKIHIRYTRGIYNTGAHMFDLLRMWTGTEIFEVQTLKLVHTSSEREGEPSYTFFFEQKNGIWGYAEAMDDEHYYLFEVDLYFSGGKIEMRFSGDEVLYFNTGKHHLFAGFNELHMASHVKGILSESMLENAMTNMAEVLSGISESACFADDAVYPLQVAAALDKSYKNGIKERVIWNE